ncbi:hypothetical protein LCGC14_1749820 [marine sediment metagenome]|uniref:Right handed beta helix domain-containing protein n=1 Tax=marine sediment metagenome TaxID=412755 RepID=A0A0F9H4A9_9ZZZZ
MTLTPRTFGWLRDGLGNARAAREIENHLGIGQIGEIFYTDPVASSASDTNTGTSPLEAFASTQSGIDAMVADRGDVLIRMRGYEVVTTPVLFNKAGITVITESYGMNPWEQGEYFAIDNTTGGAAAALISTRCRIIGLGFHTAWTGGISSNILYDHESGDPGWVYLYYCRIMNWGTATVYGVNFEAGANIVAEKSTFEGTAGQKFTAGIAFGGSPSNNPIQNTVEDCRFRDCTYAIEHKDGTPQNFLYYNNKNIDGKFLNSKGAAADGLVAGNWHETAAGSDTNDGTVNAMIGQGINFCGNHYAET